jgi:hypothetical protein
MAGIGCIAYGVSLTMSKVKSPTEKKRLTAKGPTQCVRRVSDIESEECQPWAALRP